MDYYSKTRILDNSALAMPNARSRYDIKRHKLQDFKEPQENEYAKNILKMKIKKTPALDYELLKQNSPYMMYKHKQLPKIKSGV